MHILLTNDDGIQARGILCLCEVLVEEFDEEAGRYVARSQFESPESDGVIFLDDGGIVEEGIPEEFFARPKTERAQRFLHTFEFEAVRTHKGGEEV